MTLNQYQSIYKIKEAVQDDIEGMALIICEMYDFNPEDVDDFTPREFTKYCKKVGKIFLKATKKPLLKKYKYTTKAEQLTFGQFISLQHWLKKDPISMAHLLAATIIESDKPHKELAEKLLHTKSRHSLPFVLELITSLQDLILKYAKLFEIDTDKNEDLELIKRDRNLRQHPFITQYGWLFSAKEVGEWLGLKMDEVYKLNIIEALNTLALLKSKQDYEKEMNK